MTAVCHTIRNVAPFTSQEGTVPGGRVVFSDVLKGELFCRPCRGTAIKYVERGTEVYQFGKRRLALQPGDMLVVPAMLASEATTRSGLENSTVGLCVFLPETGDPLLGLGDEPVQLRGSHTPLGRAMMQSVREFARQGKADEGTASALLAQAAQEFPTLAADLGAALDTMDGVRSRTRWSRYRQVCAAREYLHDNVDREVSLGELSVCAGVSQFQLARMFRDHFGVPPAAYHRHLRLELARAALVEGDATCAQVAARFGFGDGGSFNRAFRRQFGISPGSVLRS